MIRIGIVGAESSHTSAIARFLNIDRKVPGCRVTSVWGETPRDAKIASEQGQIAEIVKHPTDMIGKIDAACITHRHARFHLPAAWPLLEARIPLFVDKPFCYRVAEGKQFLNRATELSVPICSFSTLPKQASFLRLQKDLKQLGRVISVAATGPCDINSKHGGVFFYAVHQVDMVVRLLQGAVTHVAVNRGSKNHTATLFSADGAISTLNLFTEGPAAFHISAIAEKGRIDRTISDDDSPYHLSGLKAFCKMFKTGKTDDTRTTILTPVAVLQAMEESIKQGKKIRVSTIA